ncbi:hypothetical protein L1987_53412 [Smallanthus sonchifolius]|uniref:Uncharacterized protein n=1 Tax=Smallanthus sonchifolius TaxID=185202 RepID=A0ACB9EVU9_9ASTR|nr:hypothetical protein L1987_53412 [Smallanthus sonchifolius]
MDFGIAFDVWFCFNSTAWDFVTDSEMERNMLEEISKRMDSHEETMKSLQISIQELTDLIDVFQMLPRDATMVQHSLPIVALASALASASPDQQRTLLGENLYPLVEQLEHEHACKVMGMLLEMDQTEVLHLLETPHALKAKVAEAVEVLKKFSSSK